MAGCPPQQPHYGCATSSHGGAPPSCGENKNKLSCGGMPAQHNHQAVLLTSETQESHYEISMSTTVITETSSQSSCPPPPQAQSHYPPSQHGCPPAQPNHQACPPPPKAQSHEQYSSSTTVTTHNSSHSGSPPLASAQSLKPSTIIVPSPALFPAVKDGNYAVACFQAADRHGNGTATDKELQKSLSMYHYSFSRRIIRLLIFVHTNTHVDKIGQTEFVQLYNSLLKWKETFEKFDRDRSGRIDASELKDALASFGYAMTPPVLKKLLSKFGKGEGKAKTITYDYFIECCLTVKILSDKFVERNTTLSGSITLGYECFMCIIVPLMAA